MDPSRRSFLVRSGITIASTIGIGATRNSTFMPQKTYTVGEIIERFIAAVPGGSLKNTVDTLKAGRADQAVSGIVTTMFPTLPVIRKTIDLKANFIIVHEPTYYNHLDETSWLEDDPVYRFKKDLLDENGIAVWRNHDYIHRLQPDGVRKGVIDKLKWTAYSTTEVPEMIHVPAMTLERLIHHLKSNLGIEKLRYIGDLRQPCSSILLMPGASGGRRQIQNLSKHKPDVLVCGEISEWETAEYVRDARASGQNLALVVLGHIVSEEPGSAFLASWIRDRMPGMKVTHIPSEASLMFG